MMSNTSNTNSCVNCIVPGCFNNSSCEKQTAQEIWFYEFPKDTNIRQEWIERCGKKDGFVSDNCYLCSQHFSDDDFETPSEKKLIPTAVPTLNLQTASEESETTMICSSNTEGAPQYNLLNNQAVIQTDDKLKAQISSLEKQLKMKSRRLTQLEEKITDLYSDLDTERRETVKFQQALNYFFETTKDNFVKSQKTKEWNSDILETILMIRNFNQRCYNYLNENLDYFLPDLESLRQWVSKINFRQGLLKEVLCIMYMFAKELTNQEKITILQIGEMKVDSLHEYDAVNDEVVGPYSTMQVVIAAGLFANWKQPVYLSFDRRISKNTLNVLVNKLYEASYSVVACVSDYNKGIEDLWREMGVNAKHSHFNHPVIQGKIYYFVETSQILLNIRKILLDEGFTFTSGQKISVEPLRHLVNSHEFQDSSTSKISDRHLQSIEDDRDSLELASQLLCYDTAVDLKRLTPGPDKQLAYSTGVFIEKISNWYALTGESYTLNTQKHNITLTNMSNMISNLVVDKCENVKLLQEAILMSINSLRSLNLDLWARHNVIFNILSEKLGTSALSHLFTQISEGDQPRLTTPVKAVRQLQSIVLNRNEKDYLSQTFVSRISLPENENLIQRKYEYPSLIQGLNCKNALTESDEVLYLVAAVAHKFMDTHPTLGTSLENSVLHPNSAENPQDNTESLVEPSEEWLAQAKQLNKVFEKFHKNGLLTRQPKITKQLTNMVTGLYPAVDPEVARFFLEQRLLLRIKFLNAELDNRRKYSEE